MITQARHFLERSDAFLNAHEIITGVTQKIYSYEDLLGDPTPYFDWAAVARGIDVICGPTQCSNRRVDRSVSH
jgi:hypothetical protein